jgi:ABC-type transport system involved in multi-copper enzyme maturation permease subunit
MTAMIRLPVLRFENPVLTKEMRVRMRGSRAYWVLSGYLTFLSLILFFNYYHWWDNAVNAGGFSSSSRIGQEIFQWISITQAFLVVFITPAITSGAITIEKEQRTLEMLEMTLLSRGSIILGKILSSVGFVALLILSSLPLTSICFFLGGVSPEQVAFSYLLMLCGCLLTASIGIVWSTLSSSSSLSIAATYATLLIALPVFAILVAIMQATRTAIVSDWMWILLGLYGLTGLERESSLENDFLNVWNLSHFYGMSLPGWLVTLIVYGLTSLLLCLVAAAHLELHPERSAPRLRLATLLLLLVHCFFLFGARFSIYGSLAPYDFSMYAASSPLPVLLVYPMLFILLMTPVFGSGNLSRKSLARPRRFLLQGWTPVGWRDGTLASGLPFLLLLMLLSLLMYAGSFLLIGQPGAFLSGAPQIPGKPASVITAIPHLQILREIVFTMTAAILGIYSVSFTLSLILRNRWAVMVLMYVLLLALLIAPAVSYASLGSLSGILSGSELLIHLFYLNPLASVAETIFRASPPDYKQYLLFGSYPSWMITTVCYLFITGFAIILSVAVVVLRRKYETPVPDMPETPRRETL